MSEPPPIALTMGITLIGTIISAILYGTTITQTYLYFQRYPKDKSIMKAMPASISVRSPFLVASIDGEQSTPYSIWSLFLRSNVRTDAIVHVWLINNGFRSELKYFAKFQSLEWIAKLGLGCAAVCDLMIAAGMQLLVPLQLKNRDAQGRLPYYYHDDLHHQLWSVNRVYSPYNDRQRILMNGFSVCCALVVITFAALPGTLVFVAIFWVQGKLYCNSCLAMLNSRNALRGKLAYTYSSYTAESRGVQLKPVFASRNPMGSDSVSFEDVIDDRHTSPKIMQPTLSIQGDTTTEPLGDYKSNTEIP
ncbi:hypothetical protein BU17DRAFT_95466 [Hysterangium stoloniferum]|nr:hypothetical protein BU17DRAFT_95466 [Hysterangium stoloniferum]